MNNPNSTEKIIEEFREKFGAKVTRHLVDGNKIIRYDIPNEVEQFLTKALNDVAESAREETIKEIQEVRVGKRIVIYDKKGIPTGETITLEEARAIAKLNTKEND